MASSIAATDSKPNLKGAIMEPPENAIVIRIACHKHVATDWPDEFTMYMGANTESIHEVKMRKVQCSDCNGSGQLHLFTSTGECDKCLGYGFYAEGRGNDESST